MNDTEPYKVPPEVISYAQVIRTNYSRIRVSIFMASLLILIGISPRFWEWSKAVNAELHFQMAQRACGQHRDDANVVVFESAPKMVISELGNLNYRSVNNNSGTCRIRQPPEYWIDVASAYGITQNSNDALLFLGTLITPSGENKIVAVSRQTWGRGEDTYATPLKAFCIIPKSMFSTNKQSVMASYRSPQNARAVSMAGSSVFQMYAGQTSPQESSCFTIRYRYGDSEGLVKGKLENDGHIEFEFQSGPGYSEPETGT